MVLTEFDEEKYLKMMREEERAEGRAEGIIAGRLGNFLDVLSDLGEIPREVVERARTLDAGGLKVWTKLASRADSMEEFLVQIKEQ